MKKQTIVKLPNGDVALRIDNYIYQPVKTLIIGDVEYHHWTQYDELDGNGWLVRIIRLKME